MKTYSILGPILLSVDSAVDAHNRWDKVGHIRGEKELRKERKRKYGKWRLGKRVKRRKGSFFVCIFTILVMLRVTLCLCGFCSPAFDKYLWCLQYPGILDSSGIPMNKTGKDMCPHIFYSRRYRQAIINKPIRQSFKWY